MRTTTLDVQIFDRFEEVGQLATFGIITCDLCEKRVSPQWSRFTEFLAAGLCGLCFRDSPSFAWVMSFDPASIGRGR